MPVLTLNPGGAQEEFTSSLEIPNQNLTLFWFGIQIHSL